MRDEHRDRLPDTGQGEGPANSLNARQAAATLGVSERTIRRAIARGELHATKSSGVYRISRPDLYRYRRQRDDPVPFRGRTLSSPPHLIAVPLERQRVTFGFPRPLTSLIGRENEIESVRELIERADVPLVTLTGPGGVGKTRLAIATAAATDAFPGGTCFVDLAPVVDPRLVPTAIAWTLGVRGDSHLSVTARLAPVLQGRHLLMVIDNVEHVLDSSPTIAELLQAFPDLTVLATSRARLRISGEHEHVVMSLDTGNIGDALVGKADPIPASVRLFVDRARAIREDADLTSENAPILAAICRQLDGLPLAIELAAARLNVLTPDALLSRLQHRLPMLVGGNRDLPERQQTMRNTIAWSYELLPADAQAMFRILSVFVGGVSMPAAERVITQMMGEGTNVLDGISTLVEASLLRRLPAPGGTPRYAMLETVREYGRELLVAQEMEHNALEAHAMYFGTLDGWLDPNNLLEGRAFDHHLLEIEADYPNLRAALTHLRESGNPDAVLRLSGWLATFWHHRGYLREGRWWLEWALEHTKGTPSATRALAHAGLGMIVWTQNDLDPAAHHSREGLRIARDVGDDHVTALAIHILGLAESAQGNWPASITLLEEALELWRALSMPSNEAMALVSLSHAYAGNGNDGLARALAHDALGIFESIGHTSGMAFAFMAMGELARSTGHIPQALDAFGRSLRILTELGDRWAMVRPLSGFAGIAAANHQYQIAAQLLGIIDTRLDDEGATVVPTSREDYQRTVEATRAALGDARFTDLRRAGQSLTMQEAVDLSALIEPTLPGVSSRPHDGVEALTAREREVLELVAKGLSNADIAATLFVSVRTVRAHVASIMAKMGVQSRTAAATLALRQDLT